MEGSIKGVGIAFIIWASLMLLGGLCLGASGIMGGAMIGSMRLDAPPGAEPMPEGAQTAVAAGVMGIYGCLGIGFVVVGLIGLLSGIKLVKLKGGRTGGIIFSIVNLINIPIGTALGIWGLIVLMKDESKQLLEGGGAAG